MATNFFQRWSSRKLTPVDNTERAISETITETVDESLTLNAIDTTEEEVTKTSDHEQTSIVPSATSPNVIAEEPVIALTIDDADKVTYDSGVASFMQQQVTKSVKKAALRKLFHSEEFNYISDMDDSTEDFSNMQGLAPEIASQMRGWINTVTETATEALKDDGIIALTSTAEINTADSIIDSTTVDLPANHIAIASEDTANDGLVNHVDTTHTDEEVIPTADLSLTPIIDRDLKSDEQKS
ncbi:DUF3306 domain-containing protein [Photobacterium piscicola]|uniref:DUF3306 domain-containing protein n=1 Tax=Photobacterium piscicola TaxID=1378299 RepID=UPI002E17B5C9|nr:DUF3306 domain-containing protein [Photobacterium piscicola]MEC6881372.1 DUF3306 domain-containing protein [Photobacterium piscicola]